jgi:hypothetical protein
METAYPYALALHVLSGYLALSSGLVAMTVKKGRRAHRVAGRVFFYAMIGVSATALYIALLKNNRFLLHIGIFSFYMAYSGWRVLRKRDHRPSVFDALLVALAGLNGAFMLMTLNIVLSVFGVISVILVVGDVRLFYSAVKGKTIPRYAWLTKHIGMMIGAFIATFTAFLVVNVDGVQPAWALWLAPTALFMPVMAYHQRRVTQRLR